MSRSFELPVSTLIPIIKDKLGSLNSSKKSKTYIRRHQIKKFYKTDPTKSGNSDSKYNLKIFKNPKIKLKKDPLNYQKTRTYIRRPQIKKFYKTDPTKSKNSD